MMCERLYIGLAGGGTRSSSCRDINHGCCGPKLGTKVSSPQMCGRCSPLLEGGRGGGDGGQEEEEG